MKAIRWMGVWAMVMMSSASMAWAGKDLPVSHPVKQASPPAAAQASATQAWEGAILQTEVNPDTLEQPTRKQVQRKQLNMQYTSKRPYMDSKAPD